MLKYDPPPPEHMFPFFVLIAKVLDQAWDDARSREINKRLARQDSKRRSASRTDGDVGAEDDDADNVLDEETLAAAVEQAVRESAPEDAGKGLSHVNAYTYLLNADSLTSDKALALCATFLLEHAQLSSELWDRYVRHFVVRLYPLEKSELASAGAGPSSAGAGPSSRGRLEHRMLDVWLSSHVKHSSHAPVAALHVAAHEHETLLFALAASLKPLAALSSKPSHEFEQAFSACTDTVQLNRAMIREFYDHMKHSVAHKQNARVQEWARGFATADLRQLIAVGPDPETSRRLELMSIVHMVASTINSTSTDQDLQAVKDFLSRLEEISDEFQLQAIWSCCPQDSSIGHRLLLRWCNGARFGKTTLERHDREDVEFLFQALVGSNLSEGQRVAAMQSLLTGPEQMSPLTDLAVKGALSSSCDIIGILEDYVANEWAAEGHDTVLIDRLVYAPPWFDANTSSGFLMQTYFKL
eukprot:5173934-Prymnesium_polylepis.1